MADSGEENGSKRRGTWIMMDNDGIYSLYIYGNFTGLQTS